MATSRLKAAFEIGAAGVAVTGLIVAMVSCDTATKARETADDVASAQASQQEKENTELAAADPSRVSIVFIGQSDAYDEGFTLKIDNRSRRPIKLTSITLLAGPMAFPPATPEDAEDAAFGLLVAKLKDFPLPGCQSVNYEGDGEQPATRLLGKGAPILAELEFEDSRGEGWVARWEQSGATSGLPISSNASTPLDLLRGTRTTATGGDC